MVLLPLLYGEPHIFGLHPACIQWAGHSVSYSCLQKHLADVDNKKHHERAAVPTGRHGGSNRKRTRRAPDSESGDSGDED